MFVIGLGTATPPNRYSQTDCWNAFRAADQFSSLTPRAREILETVLTGKNGISTRFLALKSLEEAFELTPDVLHGRFREYAPLLASQAAERALRKAGCRPQDMDAVIISTCTGYLCPGLTSYVAERLGLRSDVLALDLVGQGCGAALPNLRTAEALLAAGRSRRVLSICVEICSAAFYLDNNAGVLISACLFGDGAGAAVLSGTPPSHGRRVDWMATGSSIDPADRNALCFEQREGMLRNVLSRQVPSLAARHADRVLQHVLAKAGLTPADISTWIWHAGGRNVLTALQQKLGLTAGDIQWSSAVLNDFGNLSSAFVYFVLQQALEENAPGGWWWMSSFGAGFSCHGALLKVS